MLIKTIQFDFIFFLKLFVQSVKGSSGGEVGTGSKAIDPETGPSWLQPACVWEGYSLCVKVGQSKVD